MIKQKRILELDFVPQELYTDSSGVFTLGDLRTFLKRANLHKLPNDTPVFVTRHAHRFENSGFFVEWTEWTDGQEEEEV